MGLTKEWDNKNKCWKIPHTARNIKAAAAQIGKLVPVIGSLAVSIAKEIYIQKLKSKGYCKEDIKWVQKNI